MNSPATSPPSLDDLLARLRAYRREAGLSYSSFALKAGLSRAALIGMDEADWSPSGDTIRALERLVEDWRPGDRPAAVPEAGDDSLLDATLAGLDAVAAAGQAASRASGPAQHGHLPEADRRHDATAPRDWSGRDR
jgi:hypothetical protein